jgi:hypothetical protein
MRPRNGGGAPESPTETSSGPIRAVRQRAGAVRP